MIPSYKITIVITGAAGFIGSSLVRRLNEDGLYDLVLVDDFRRVDKFMNLVGKRYLATIDRHAFIKWFEKNSDKVGFVYHLGARTDTTETDPQIFHVLNLLYTKSIWNICARHNIRMIYASSAATYGSGEFGYKDNHTLPKKLHPLNLYGKSKNDFDKWAINEAKRGKPTPPLWVGLKFFNVYGPNEYHKGRMSSVIYHTVKQIKETGGMKLFRSHRPDFADGEQKRDFVYVKDVVEVLRFLLTNWTDNGLYNVGTGNARTFSDLARLTFTALGREPNISFIDIPEDIRENYQYFTEANIDKLRKAGYNKKFRSLEEGIEDYVKHYLLPGNHW